MTWRIVRHPLAGLASSEPTAMTMPGVWARMVPCCSWRGQLGAASRECPRLTAVPTLYLAFQIGSVGLAAIPIEQFFAAVILHGLMYGGAFAVAAAIFMGMTSPAVAATQFTAYMALGNIAISIGNFWQGMVAERIGYAAALYLDAALILLPLAVLPFLRNRESRADAATLEPALAAD